MNIAILIIGSLNLILHILSLIFYYREKMYVNERIDETDWEIESIKENVEELATASNDADEQINELLEANEELEGELLDVKSDIEEVHLKIDIVASQHGNTTVDILPMLPKKRQPN